MPICQQAVSFCFAVLFVGGNEHLATTRAHVSINTMHFAKLPEFRAVVLMAFDSKVIPPKVSFQANRSLTIYCIRAYKVS